MRTQYATQFLLSKLAKRCDDIAEENYEIPVAANQRRLQGNATSVLGADGLYSFADSDYADSKELVTYDASHFVLRSDISQVDANTLERINTLIEAILSDKTVRDEQLRSVFTDAQWAYYAELLQEVRHTVEIDYADGMPSELARYNELLNRADFALGKAERYAAKARYGWKYKQQTISRAYNNAETLYESAVQYLQEQFETAERNDYATYHQLTKWMDRDVKFGEYGNVFLSNAGVPRVRGSKSQNAQDAGLPKLSKRLKREESMLMALMVAACDIAFVLPQAQPEASSPVVSRKLQEFLSNINSERD